MDENKLQKFLAEKQFGRWTVLSKAASNGRGARWLCKCSCGTIRVVPAPRLTSGRSTSCGCGRKEKLSATLTTHDMTDSPEYSSWIAMKSRCFNPKHKNYPLYGGKGITIFPFWIKSFEAFFNHIGPKPSPKHSIDRYPNGSGNYEPGNVRWATQTEQIRNSSRTKLNENQVVEIRRLLTEGKLSKREIARRFNVSKGPISQIENGETWKEIPALMSVLGKEGV